MAKKILLIDNFDSFTFNLRHLIIETAPEIQLDIVRNNEHFLPKIEAGNYVGVVIGPGPGSPLDKAYFGHNDTVIQSFGTQGLPVLGICLGFQGIFSGFGGALKVASLPMHGKLSALKIKSPGRMLESISEGAQVMRYHSILADVHQPIPECLKLLAYAEDEISNQANGMELMAIEHETHPIFGLQFHPESFATQSGHAYIRNFIRLCN